MLLTYSVKEESHPPGRNADGTFVPGSEAAKEAGHKGGLSAAGEVSRGEATHQCPVLTQEQTEDSHAPGRNPDGTFVKGSEAAKEAGHKGGVVH